MAVVVKSQLCFALAFCLLLFVALWSLRPGGERRFGGRRLIHYNEWDGGEHWSLPPIGRKDEDWLSLAFGGYQGPEFRLAIGEIALRLEAITQDGGMIGPAVRQLDYAVLSAAEISLASAIDDTGLFDVVELEEQQDRNRSAGSGSRAVAETSVMQSAAYLLLASIDEFLAGPAPDARLYAAGAGGVESRVSMSFQILDGQTAQVLFSTVEHAAIVSPEDDGLGTFRDFRSSEVDAPTPFALRACINKGIWRVANWFKDRPWNGSVSQVLGQEVGIDAGTRHGLEVGMALIAFSGKKQLFDSETGLVVGSVTGEIGRLQIVEVEEQTSTARIVEGCEGIKSGDRVELRGVNRTYR